MNKKNKDIIYFFKADKIAQQAIDILKGKKDSNSSELDQYIRENEYSDNLIKKLTNSDTIAKIRATDKDNNRYNSLRSIQVEMIRRRVRRRRNRVIIYSLLSSSAAILLLSFLLFNYTYEDTQTHFAQEIKLETPTLILGSGDNIALQAKDTLEEAVILGHNKLSYVGSQSSKEAEYNTVIIPKGYTYTVILADSTEVFLNAGSELRYPVKFGTNAREVFLKGEGYFKVKKKPVSFIVNTSDVSVKVYGTVFNINTNGSKNIETLLVSGSVGVTVKGDNKEVMIKPSQLFTLNKTDKTSQVKNVNIENYLAWTQNMFKCDEEELSVMLDKIAIWYGVEFEYTNKEICRTKIDIKISRKSDLFDILRAIEKVSGAIITKTNQSKYVVE